MYKRKNIIGASFCYNIILYYGFGFYDKLDSFLYQGNQLAERKRFSKELQYFEKIRW